MCKGDLFDLIGVEGGVWDIEADCKEVFCLLISSCAQILHINVSWTQFLQSAS